MNALVRPAFAVVLLAGLVACGGEEPVELTEGDACGDAFFWAATGSGDVAVTVAVDARDRSPADAMTRDFGVPEAGIVVEVLEGENLQRNFCNDVLDTSAEPRDRQEAVAGEGAIRLDPTLLGSDLPHCGSVSGVLELTGLEAEDGTTFAPIRVASDSIGCYSG